MLLVRWRKSYGAVIDENLKTAVVPKVPNPAVAAREGSVTGVPSHGAVFVTIAACRNSCSQRISNISNRLEVL